MKCPPSSQVVQSCEIWCCTLLWALSFPTACAAWGHHILVNLWSLCSLEISRRRAILLLLRRAAIFRATQSPHKHVQHFWCNRCRLTFQGTAASYALMILQPSGQPSGSADQRISGSADQRISGSADQRISGPADQRTSGPADQRISGSADQRISGSADQRISGSADQWISGSADQRTEPRDPRISSSTDSAKCYLFVLVNCFPHTRLPFAHCRFIPQEIVPLTS